MWKIWQRTKLSLGYLKDEQMLSRRMLGWGWGQMRRKREHHSQWIGDERRWADSGQGTVAGNQGAR